MTNTEEAGLLKRLEAFLSKDKNLKTLSIEKDGGGFVLRNSLIDTPKSPSLEKAIEKFLDKAETKI